MASVMRAAASGALAILLAGPVLGQGQGSGPEGGGEGSGSDRCAGWNGPSPTVTPFECQLRTVPTEIIRSDEFRVPAEVYEATPLPPELFESVDRDPADSFRLDGAPIDGTPDPATDIKRVHHGRFTLDRREARELMRVVRSPELRDQVVLGVPPGQLFKPGAFDLFAIDLAGDPTTDPSGNRIFQLVFMGADPLKSVASTIPETNPLAGGRHVVTIFQQPGDAPDRALLSDFGSRKLGPDGQTQYYNVPARVMSLTTPEGIFVITPAALDPIGFRVEAFDATTGAWDFLGAPDGPMAFIPQDGSAPSTLQLPVLQLRHEPVEGQDLLLGDQRLEDQTMPSGFILFAFPGEDGIQAVATVDLEVERRRLLYEDRPLESLVDTPLVELTMGIPSYGRYCVARKGATALRGLDGEPVTWSDGSPAILDADELRRVLGASCWRVDSQEGLLHQAATAGWLNDLAAGDPASPMYDPAVAERLFEEAGWVRGADGRWDSPAP